MLTKRFNRLGFTEIVVSNDPSAPWDAYRITCMDVDIDRKTGARAAPTARISLLSYTNGTIEVTRRLAAEYSYVADVAEALQAEKRAAFTPLPPPQSLQ